TGNEIEAAGRDASADSAPTDDSDFTSSGLDGSEADAVRGDDSGGHQDAATDAASDTDPGSTANHDGAGGATDAQSEDLGGLDAETDGGDSPTGDASTERAHDGEAVDLPETADDEDAVAAELAELHEAAVSG